MNEIMDCTQVIDVHVSEIHRVILRYASLLYHARFYYIHVPSLKFHLLATETAEPFHNVLANINVKRTVFILKN